MHCCCVDGCANPVHVKRLQMCKAHYARLRRHGDPTSGGPIRAPRAPAQPVADHPDGTRTCNTCQQRQPLENFPRDKNGSRGHRTCCKICHSAKQTARYQADPEPHKSRLRQYRADNPDLMRRLDRERYEREREQRIAYAIDAVHRRRALLATVPCDKGITIKALVKKHGAKCYYCRCNLVMTRADGREYLPNKATIEHLDPISRGGTHTWDNVRPACWQCNIRKNAKSYEEWQLSQGVTPLRW